MAIDTVRVGIVGLGTNTRLRHVPGLRACRDVEITAVCNRRPESTAAAAKEFGIPSIFSTWQELVRSDQIDAVVIGTWPYLHCPITLAALEAGKHVLTEARMAMNTDEARQMLEASRHHPDLVTQIVPGPCGLEAHQVMKDLLADGYLGQLREVAVLCAGDSLADPNSPIHWRQDASLSGVNMLALGILHETLIRWVPDPIRVLAQLHTFTTERLNSETGQRQTVTRPDSVHVLTHIFGDARGVYHFSGVTRFGPREQIHLYGSEGTLKCSFAPRDRIMGGRKGDGELQEIPIPKEKAGGWRVEADFIDAIRGTGTIEFTDFATGVRYMEFTDAVARSAETGAAVSIPAREGS